ncbi:LLM class flavin-dependent oxidoreductase [Candidatus Bathyarchaeota archaeon]|nr:LLM class flavin-dependent oxidoreductase [Candidatus Bathyarchaeota archaeon]
MKFFLTGLGNLYDNMDPILKGVIEADKQGLDGVLMPDHYMWGQEIGHSMQRPYHTLETWTTLTYLAGKTEKIRLGTLITPLPFRHPGMLAKMLSTLDVLSGGRVVLGAGAGWSRVEFEGYSEWLGTKSRVDKTIEALSIIKRLWREDSVTHESGYYHIKDAVLMPKPVQRPYPKILFGSSGDRMLKLTGREGDICFIPPWQGHRFHEMKETVLIAAEEASRADKIEFMGGVMGVEEPFNAENYSRFIADAEEKGCTYCNVAFPRDSIVTDIRRFAKEVLPSYS